MKVKYILLIIAFFSFTAINEIMGQSLLDSIIQVKMGTSRFQTINDLNLSENANNIKTNMSYWTHPENTNDSVLISSVSFTIQPNKYVNSRDNTIVLFFANNVLTKIEIEIRFKPKSLNKCLENYKLDLNALGKEFPIREKYKLYKDTITKEQSGEVYYLYKKAQNTSDFECSIVGYQMEYNIIYNDKLNKTIITPTVIDYLLQVEYVEFPKKDFDIMNTIFL